MSMEMRCTSYHWNPATSWYQSCIHSCCWSPVYNPPGVGVPGVGVADSSELMCRPTETAKWSIFLTPLKEAESTHFGSHHTKHCVINTLFCNHLPLLVINKKLANAWLKLPGGPYRWDYLSIFTSWAPGGHQWEVNLSLCSVAMSEGCRIHPATGHFSGCMRVCLWLGKT